MKSFKTFNKEKNMDDFEEDVLPTYQVKDNEVKETKKEEEEKNENI